VCIHRVLCPIKRPVTTLDCPLLKDIAWSWQQCECPRSTLEPVSECQQGRATVSCAVYPTSTEFFSLCLPRYPQCRLQPNKMANLALRCEFIDNLISTYSTMSGDPKESHISNALSHCHTKGDFVLAAFNDFRAAWSLTLYKTSVTLCTTCRNVWKCTFFMKSKSIYMQIYLSLCLVSPSVSVRLSACASVCSSHSCQCGNCWSYFLIWLTRHHKNLSAIYQ
jgi:hypothetical protein